MEEAKWRRSGRFGVLLRKTKGRFVETPCIKGVLERLQIYLRAGLPVHLSGPAGTGKTAIAMRLVALLGRPVVLMHGDEEIGTSDMVGGLHGYEREKLSDNYIQSVRKVQERVAPVWVDNRLTQACKNGLTLLYDEVNRSRPEANNVLLSVLEEGYLDVSGAGRQEAGFKVHPKFRAVFTSNPEEYAGVHKIQDALRDRMVTITLEPPDRESEIAITQAQSGLSRADAEKVIEVVRGFWRMARNGHHSTLRASIMVGRCLVQIGAGARPGNPLFESICADILGGNGMHRSKAGHRTADFTTRHLLKGGCHGEIQEQNGNGR